jgi:hypothetical protein
MSQQLEHHEPSSHLIESYAAREVSVETCIFEFIDNSLDAGARVIRIDIQTGKNSYLIVSDDGEGCSDLNLMRVPGKRVDLATTVSGRFGIGGTIASIALAGVSGRQSIESVKRGILYASDVKWSLVKANNWGYPPIKERPAQQGSVGTVIRIEPLVRSARSWKDLPPKIATHFWPALTAKPVPATILIRLPGSKDFQPIAAPAFPKLSPGAIDTVVNVGQRRARVRCGIVPAGTENTMLGFSYFLTDRRVIEARSPNGASGGGEDYSVANIHATVELIGKPKRWDLSDHKNRIKNGQALYAVVFQHCKTLLKKAEDIGESVELKKFMKSVENMVNGVDGEEEAGSSGGGQDPNPGPPRPGPRPAPDPQPNPISRKKQRKEPRLQFNWRALGDKYGVGTVDRKFVTLNLSTPYVADLKASRDRDRTALLVLMLWNLARSLPGSGAQRRMDFMDNEALDRLSKGLADALGNLKRTSAEPVAAAEYNA